MDRNVRGRKEMTLCQYMAGWLKAINKLCITLSSVYGAFQNHTEEWRGGPLPHCIALHSVHVHLYANTQFYNVYCNVNESLTEVSEY
jgi:hypothetical protein